MTKALNLKNMSETYKQMECNNSLWHSFYNLQLAGFISYELWSEFYDMCKSWTYDSQKEKVYDMDKEIYID